MHGVWLQYNSPDELSSFETLFLGPTDSLLSHQLTKEIWEEYKDKADAYGVSFNSAYSQELRILTQKLGSMQAHPIPTTASTTYLTKWFKN